MSLTPEPEVLTTLPYGLQYPLRPHRGLQGEGGPYGPLKLFELLHYPLSIFAF